MKQIAENKSYRITSLLNGASINIHIHAPNGP